MTCPYRVDMPLDHDAIALAPGIESMTTQKITITTTNTTPNPDITIVPITDPPMMAATDTVAGLAHPHRQRQTDTAHRSCPAAAEKRYPPG